MPTRLLHPQDFPGKSTGVGCHCLVHNGNDNTVIILTWNWMRDRSQLLIEDKSKDWPWEWVPWGGVGAGSWEERIPPAAPLLPQKKKMNKKRFEKITHEVKTTIRKFDRSNVEKQDLELQEWDVCVKKDMVKDNKVENRLMTWEWELVRRTEDGIGKWSGSSHENTSGLNLFRLLSQNCQRLGGLLQNLFLTVLESESPRSRRQ